MSAITKILSTWIRYKFEISIVLPEYNCNYQKRFLILLIYILLFKGKEIAGLEN
jgi:hypothetical protein